MRGGGGDTNRNVFPLGQVMLPEGVHREEEGERAMQAVHVREGEIEREEGEGGRGGDR